MASQSGWVDGQNFSSTTVKFRGLGLSRFFISETYGVWVLLSFWAAVPSAAGGGALLLHNLEAYLPQRLHAICGASLRAPCLQHAPHTRDVCGLAEHCGDAMVTKLTAAMMIVTMLLITMSATTLTMWIAEDDDVLDGYDNGVSVTCA